MRIGEHQELRIVRETQHGLYLADADGDEVLLPRGQSPKDARLHDRLQVFVLTDSEDRPVATTKKPLAAVGEFAKLRVVGLIDAGAFLDWGLDKDLFCPLKEQRVSMRVGEEYLVRVYLDPVSQRVVCTSKFAKYLSSDGEGLTLGQPIQIMVAERSRELISVIIEGRIKGSIFPDEWHERLEIGEVRQAFVKNVRREDGKVSVSLRPQGYQAVLGERDRLLQALEANGGSLPVSDRSSPDEIQRRFGLSKGSFKKLLGTLYKEGRVLIEKDRIVLKRG